MESRILTLVYTFFLGIMLALFVGLGISTFYEGPKAPEYPISIEAKYPTAEQQQANRQYEQDMRDYQQRSQVYSRNVSIIALIFSVALLIISLVLTRFNPVIVNGILIGGLLTLLYSIVRGFASQDNKMTFATVSVGLLVAIYLGYRRFSHKVAPKDTEQEK